MKDNLSAYNSSEYDRRIGSVLPYYEEFHTQILDLVRALSTNRIKWLDTGCGTGGLAQKALEIIPNTEFTLCDPSENMINTAKQKLNNYNIRYYNLSSQELSFSNEFDIVTAVQAHHYLDMESRKKATQCCYKALKNGGIYISFENIALSSTQSESISIRRWENFQKDNGKTDNEIKAHISRRGTEVFPIKIEQHLQLIKACGFKSADILWASYMQAGFFAIK